MIVKANIMAATADANAAASEILIPKIAYVRGKRLVGTMPNNAGDTAAVSSHASGTSIHVVPAAGYYDGSDDAATITDADFVASNVYTGIDIFGLTGALNCYGAQNIVTNGNFTSTTGWSAQYSTNAAASNTLTNTGTGGAVYATAYQAITVVNGNKYYYKAKVRVTNTSCTSLELQTNVTVAPPIVSQASPTQNTWYTLSGEFTANSDGYVRLRHYYADATTQNGKVMECQYVLLLNKTLIFGSGSEPSTASMDTWIAGAKNYSSTLWFDGVGRIFTWTL